MMEKKAYSYVRFSRPEQLKGNSLERQLEASRKWAAEHNLTLDESLQDLGLSAFHGIHREKGALGKFLELVKSNKVPIGSYLIVENLDRLSREDVDDAYDQFRSIIKAGITIVTLQDGMAYSKESMKDNWVQLIISIVYMARANDESKRKSQRLSDVWKTKREKALKGKKITGRCPAWLKLKDDGTFEVIKPAVDAINLIYDLKLAGKGCDKIERELNQSNLWKPSGRKGKAPSWRKSYIIKLLYNNRAVIGEYQPHVIVNGKRQKIGEPINYYPPIVSLDKFNRVQEQIHQNSLLAKRGSGRNDKISNLFGHLAVCKVCGYPMSYLNKGVPPKGGQYLVCDKQRRKIDGGCKAKPIKYEMVEKNILLYCEGLNVSDIVQSDKKVKTQLSAMQEHLQAVDGKITDISSRLENLYDTIETTSSKVIRDTLNHRASAYVIEREKLQKEKETLNTSINNILSTDAHAKEQLKNIAQLIQQMKTMEGQERVNLRLNLRNQLRLLISEIKIETNPPPFVFGKALINNPAPRIEVFFKTGKHRLIQVTESSARVRVRDRQL